LDATEISVGGGGSKPGKFGVYNASGSQIGFIGVESGNEGGWFKTLSVGGTSYSTGIVRADGSGNVTINGATLTLNLNGITTVISNATDGIGSVIAGMRITDNSTSYYTSYRANSVSLTDGSVSRVLISAGGGSPDPGGRVSVSNTSGSTTITLTGGTGIVSASSFSIGATPGTTASTSVLTGLTVTSVNALGSLSVTTAGINYLDAAASVNAVTGVNTTLVSAITGVTTTSVTLEYLDHNSDPKTQSVITSVSSSTTSVFSFSSLVTTTLTRNSSTLVSNVSASVNSIGSASGLTSATLGFTGGIRTS
jgi:hypothetical protein